MTKKEIKTLRELIERYRAIYAQTDLMQKSIESLAKKRDEFLHELDNMKEEEQRIMGVLIKKYGASEITPNKLLKIL